MVLNDSGAYSMPSPMPEYPPPPYRLEAVEGANFLCTLPTEVIATLLPDPLVANAEGILWLYLFHLEAAEPLAFDYHEVGLFVPVTCNRQQGVFSLALFLDESLPITIGREVWGFPKKFADSIAVRREQNCCNTKLVHQGSTLLEATFCVTEEEVRLEAEQTHRVYTHRMIPSWRPDQPSIDQIVALNWLSANETRWKGKEAKLQVAFPESSSLRVLNTMRCVKSWYSRTETCILEGGEVVCDFSRSSTMAQED